MNVAMLLYLAAFILFVLGALGVPSSRFNLVAAGLACWVLAIVLGGLKV